MKPNTRSLTTPLALATISLAACDNPLTTPYPSARTAPKPDVTAGRTEAVGASATMAMSQASGSFQIEVIPADAGAEALLSTIRRAAGRWMRILRHTELPEVQFDEGPKRDCIGLRLDEGPRVVDDLAILVSVRNMDGLGGTLALSGPCWVHWDSSLPYLGGLILDQADVAELDARGISDLVVHEIGHVLGIGSLWGNFGFLRNPSLFAPGADTHFEGNLAIAAFDNAGGAGYLHGKVPVENVMGAGSADVHWREGVLGPELMTPVLVPGESSPLSAITIQSLADMGYAVDLALAEEFTVPARGGGGNSNGGRLGIALSLAKDVQDGPVLAHDPDGRLVEVTRRRSARWRTY